MKKLLSYLVILFLTLILTACSGDDSTTTTETNTETPSEPTYNIGETGPAGGIIFYIDDEGYKYEVGNSLGLAKWENIENLYEAKDITGLNIAIGSGETNTQLIIASIGEGSYAAKMCSDHQQGGKTDWFLPSKDELVAIYNYFDSCGCMGLSPSNNYWSSSQGSDYTRAWNTDFSVNSSTTQFNNWTFEVQKNQTLYVRPIRKF
ncbi:hypothetical protein V1389_03790 [Flavobacterium rakeshii]|uniref:hypothetical protein n=1 Tax=Flavobacterium rakeshii TaxID=1038845 RepID=UPI002E7B8A63|nr:hypothetical protein [Flavobacterium rakeshii]MEE1897444.1 hypothetical protein [Flavobacterium rakeshii]